MRTTTAAPINIWRIATDTTEYVADDRTGAGAKATGGRWNTKGTPMLYCSENIALACLETLVHIKAGSLPLNRYVVRIEVPHDLWSGALELDAHGHPGWDAIPFGMVSQRAGQKWVASSASALYKVPSVIVPQERNVLINPRHPDAAKLRFHKSRNRWTYDSRLR
ncbi:RES family NAD+ phosphorylase [Trinickia symbiotica]|uniref:RES family NAD+ phosphorylase n=1 Tax=Trinickia symbiotica TaxID=863227 RepID=UPI00294FFFD0|nr:RES family NAD+ phosphorylase [Trinickia symbiotica]